MCAPTPVDREHAEREEDPLLQLRDPARCSGCRRSCRRSPPLPPAASIFCCARRARRWCTVTAQLRGGVAVAEQLDGPRRACGSSPPRDERRRRRPSAPLAEAGERADVHDLRSVGADGCGSRASACAARAASGRLRSGTGVSRPAERLPCPLMPRPEVLPMAASRCRGRRAWCFCRAPGRGASRSSISLLLHRDEVRDLRGSCRAPAGASCSLHAPG